MSGNYAMNFLALKLRKFKRMLSVPPGKLVLDVGSGDAPFPRADVICDKYLLDTDRVGGLVIDRPFVVGSITALPFLDKSFDFVYCSHVLEHVDRPATAAMELMRVAKSGYIEVPSEIQEKIRSTPVHKWYVSKENDTLVFKKKDREIFDRALHEAFGKLIEAKDRAYRSFFFRHNYDLLNIEYYWKDEIKVRLNGGLPPEPEGKANAKSVPAEEILRRLSGAFPTGGPRGIRRFVKSLIKNILTKGGRVELLKIIACPVCKNGVVKDGGSTLTCSGCGKKYPVYRGVPVMLEEYSI